jgi:tRNA dimethylallyltransferase
LEKNSVVIICGPTSSGKSSWALKYAKSHNGEIVNCDFAQCYSFIQVGTGRPLLKDMEGVNHHLYGFFDDPVPLSSYFLRKKIENCCSDILERGKLPIVVGGSHFYIYSLFFDFFDQTRPLERNKLEISWRQGKATGDLWKELLQRDSKRAMKIHQNDRYRIERALDILDKYGEIRELLFNPLFNYRVFEKDYNCDYEEKLEKAVNNFFENGWIEEVEALKEDQKVFLKKKKIIGYDTIIDFIEFKKNKDLCSLQKEIFLKTKQYVKFQKKFIKKLFNDLKSQNVLWEKII